MPRMPQRVEARPGLTEAELHLFHLRALTEQQGKAIDVRPATVEKRIVKRKRSAIASSSSTSASSSAAPPSPPRLPSSLPVLSSSASSSSSSSASSSSSSSASSSASSSSSSSSSSEGSSSSEESSDEESVQPPKVPSKGTIVQSKAVQRNSSDSTSDSDKEDSSSNSGSDSDSSSDSSSSESESDSSSNDSDSGSEADAEDATPTIATIDPRHLHTQLRIPPKPRAPVLVHSSPLKQVIESEGETELESEVDSDPEPEAAPPPKATRKPRVKPIPRPKPVPSTVPAQKQERKRQSGPAAVLSVRDPDTSPEGQIAAVPSQKRPRLSKSGPTPKTSSAQDSRVVVNGKSLPGVIVDIPPSPGSKLPSSAPRKDDRCVVATQQAPSPPVPKKRKRLASPSRTLNRRLSEADVLRYHAQHGPLSGSTDAAASPPAPVDPHNEVSPIPDSVPHAPESAAGAKKVKRNGTVPAPVTVAESGSRAVSRSRPSRKARARISAPAKILSTEIPAPADQIENGPTDNQSADTDADAMLSTARTRRRKKSRLSESDVFMFHHSHLRAPTPRQSSMSPGPDISRSSSAAVSAILPSSPVSEFSFLIPSSPMLPSSTPMLPSSTPAPSSSARRRKAPRWQVNTPVISGASRQNRLPR